MKNIPCAIIAHGGAGGIGHAQRRSRGLHDAVSSGYRMLMQGSSSLDAVEKACVILEDAPIFNAGTGSSLNLQGIVEMDASIMTSNGHFGAVGALRDVKNPIRVARLVMEKTDHLLLCGDYALRFARLMGIPYYNPKTKERVYAWKQRRKSLRSDYFKKLRTFTDHYGTVGVVAIDNQGMISVATSSGGIILRMPGRVGDTPIIGGGTYADRHGGVGTTGHGEEIMRLLLAYRTVALMARHSAQAAGRRAMQYATQHDCRCGLIGIDRHGMIVHLHNSNGMSWCSVKHGSLKMFEY